jgi:anti-sigma B factor antagonist
VLAADRVLDPRGSDRLRALLEDAVAPRRRVVVDLSAVEHLSSVALAVLVSGHRRLRDGGGALVLRTPSPAVLRELRISGLHRVFEVEPTTPAAGHIAGTTTSS